MKAIILAAGRGSRMKNLTDEKPKCLVELQGRTLLDWQLTALRQAGVEDIAIVTGYKHELLQGFGLTEFHNARWAETNMVSSLMCASQWLQTGPCIISYSDIFYQSSAIELLINSSEKLAITFDPNWLKLWEKRFSDPLVDAETFRISERNYLLEIGNKPKSIEEIQGQYMGILRFTPESFSDLFCVYKQLELNEQKLTHMTGMLQRIIDAGRINIYATPYDGVWGEVDSTDDLVVAIHSVSN